MNFEVGETVVYPHHGAATITAVRTRTVKGTEKTYITLDVHQSELKIELPVDNVELVGVRDVIDSQGVEAVFDVLRSDIVEEPGNWSRRYKANAEKMGSGSVLRVSEVVRDLWRRDQEHGVSAGEKRMLAKARDILVSELALARGSSIEDASAVLDEVLATVAA
jgi:CarD family transcriptional regulator